MDTLVSIIYALVIAFIRSYKFVELQFFKLINYPLQRLAIYLGEKLGLVLQLPGKPEISVTEEKRILKESGYPTLIRIKINDVSIFPLLANQGTLAALEGYLNGKVELVGDEAQLTEVINRILVKDLMNLYFLHPINKLFHYLELEAFNLQTIGRAFQIADVHYDAGNTLIESYLGPTMQYSSAYWASADNLNDAQINKMELIAKKLDLKPGMRVLDVGCGWGILCKYLAENYGVECVGISVSKEGVKYGQSKMGKNLNVELRVQDYRDLNEKFDRIVSIECLEHVGPHNYRTFFKAMKNSLKDDGIFLLHCTGINHKNFIRSEPFTHKYLFPNIAVPYYLDVCKHIEGSFIIEDWHNIGPDFGKTYKAWAENFEKQKMMICEKYGEKVYKLWKLYLLLARALFKSRKMQVWQIVLSKNGLMREYRAAR